MQERYQMSEETPNPQPKDDKKKGVVLVLTGPGKGKSSSALGMVLRALGWGMRVCVIQFIKGQRKTGEEQAIQKFSNIEWHALGDGFTWKTKDPEQDRITGRETWRFARQKIQTGCFDLVLLDEINYAAHYGWISGKEIATFITHEKPAKTHLLLTGRNAPLEVIEVADTVTEMQAVKHAYEKGITAKRGIEF
ncbi:MAG: cob(I)yrinic acid a,c-diamide adenosyltransferase [Magnetococcales bacterium]|nr:cob(I)yrinic acid a,c-diamide adenosyltransferase [Magnetococcales bacterium]